MAGYLYPAWHYLASYDAANASLIQAQQYAQASRRKPAP